MILVFVLNIRKLNWISIDGGAVQLISSYLKLRSNIILSTSTKWKEVFITCIFHFILIFALAYFMSSGTNSYVIPMLKAIPCSLPKLTERKVISSFKLIVSKICHLNIPGSFIIRVVYFNEISTRLKLLVSK